MKRWQKWVLGLVGCIAVMVMAVYCIPVPRAAVDIRPVPSVRLLDRHGRLLREVLSTAEGTAAWVDLDGISPDVVAATLAAEDHRFWRHPGVDPVGIGRAFWQNARAHRIESGASTIEMQLVGNATGVHPSTIRGKAWQALQSIRLFTVLSRRQILVRYLNTIPYGHQTFGIEAASRFYFNCHASQLSLSQAAMLAAIPAAPSVFDPLSNLDRVRDRQRYILQSLRALGWVDTARIESALAETVTPHLGAEAFMAPHFCDMVVRHLDGRHGDVRTTLDLDLQHDVEGILHQRLAALKDRKVTNGAVVVLDNRSGDVLAWVGSSDYATAQVDGVLARRQPGSTLKPFTYGLALERGWTPASILPDMPFRYGGVYADYRPENYDGTFHGQVSMRTALACSYNAPAVYVLSHIGAGLLLDRLHTAGFESLDQPASHYGLGLTLGDGDVRLIELAGAYRALADQGVYRPERIFIESSNRGRMETVFSDRVTALLTDILSDHTARIPAFGPDSVLNLPFPCAAKTGTSNDFHDNWTVGYTPAVTVAVWVGNFDASPLYHVSGVTGAGGVFRDVMLRASRDRPEEAFPRPAGLVEEVVCPASGLLAGPDCPTRVRELFIRAYRPHKPCDVHRRIHGHVVTVYPEEVLVWRRQAGLPVDPSFGRGTVGIQSPSDGEVFRLDPILRVSAQALHLAVLPPDGTRTVQWYVDGDLYRTVPPPFSARWVLKPGAHRFYAVSNTWRSGEVHILVR